jgi:hypothetical protein
MGFIFSQDGECVVCKRVSTRFCDACRRYVCDEHHIEVIVAGSVEKCYLCQECCNKGKKPINKTLKGKNPHYDP